jgi:hypothetical protein
MKQALYESSEVSRESEEKTLNSEAGKTGEIEIFNTVETVKR